MSCPFGAHLRSPQDTTVPLTHIEQVIKAGYKTYSKMDCKYLPSTLTDGKISVECEDDFYSKANATKNQYTDKQFKLWEPMDHDISIINGVRDVRKKPQKDLFGNFGIKKALLGWRSELVRVENDTSAKLMHSRANIYVGQDFIFTRNVGWHLTRYGNIKVLKRMWTVVESGVYDKLLKTSYKPPLGKTFDPRRLSIQGNISVQFVFHLLGLAFAWLVLVVELRKTYVFLFWCLCVKIDFLVTNFLQQSQKVFLFGLKYVLNTRNKLWHL